jgi:predicted DNA-binding protein (MmcQ/YjbR family)
VTGQHQTVPERNLRVDAADNRFQLSGLSHLTVAFLFLRRNKMNARELHEKAKQIAETLPGSYPDFPFGPEHLVYRVENKIFLFVSEIHGKRIVTLKSDPDQAMINKSIFSGIQGGYHMNKKHWITIVPDSQ